MAEKRWLLYGAYGFTGRLIAEEARRRGMSPVVGGRRAEAVQEVADQHDLDAAVFDLDDTDGLARLLEPYDAVVLAAGPFARTSAPVVQACLRARTHYLDITGEVGVFESIFRRDAEARERGVALLPGVGFDVVPTDCLAATLKTALPDATHLELAFAGLSSTSPGTAKTMVEGLPQGGAIRRDGRIVSVPPAYDVKEIPFRDKPRMALTIPWGDVSTAYHSTAIPNIQVYMALPPQLIRGTKLMRPFRKLLGVPVVQDAMKSWVDRNIEGPDAHTRAVAKAQLWGRVHNDAGRSVEGTLVTPETYHLTALTAVEATRRLLEEAPRQGALTPSAAFGADFITSFEGCELHVGEATP
jgi:short subunit dehydrogenase-like uncharacterized protein